MSILLTGSNGFLGKYIFEELKNNSIKVLNRTKSDINCDLINEIPIITEKFELVIHNAGLAHIVPTNSIQNQLFNKVNVNGSLNLLKAFTKQNLPTKFVYISSVSVYGLIEGTNLSEDFPLLANDPYGRSKIEAERIVLSWCKENNVICTILRLPLVAGSNPPGNLGFMINGIKKGYYFNIGGGIAKKSMVLATDVAKYIEKASNVGGVFNLTDGIHPSFNELSKYISLIFGKSFVPNMPITFAILLAKIGDIFGSNFFINSNKLLKILSTLTFNDSKARIAFGWNPTPVLIGLKIE